MIRIQNLSKIEQAMKRSGRTWPGLKDKSASVRAVTRAVKDALEAELTALHNLQSACQVALRDVPHQKDCARQGHDAAECTCIRSDIASLEAILAEQLDSVLHVSSIARHSADLPIKTGR